jgi:hypothetical protein
MASSPFVPGSASITQGQTSASPARGAIMSFSGSHSSPSSQHNVPSPATFAKMAAAVGVQNPLLDDPRRASGNNTEIVVSKPQDSYAEMLSQADNFLNVQLTQLEAAGNIFFDL